MLKASKVKRSFFVIVGICGLFYVISSGTRPNTAVPLLQDNKYISPLCTCDKIVSVTNRDALNQRFHWCSMESDLRGDHQRVLTYTLFGPVQNATIFNRYYTLMKNLSQTVDKEYPGWVIRFYHAFTQQDHVAYKSLCDVYCQFPHVDLCSVEEIRQSLGDSVKPIPPALLQGLNHRMYRYLAMLDPNVDIFMSRDIDSFIYKREVEAVNQWLQSAHTFHVMRDHPHHQPIMLAGMWGAKLYRRRNAIRRLAQRIIASGQNQLHERDQTTLRAILWPAVRSDVMAHDSYLCRDKKITSVSSIKAFPFPTQRTDGQFVGGVGDQRIFVKCPAACRPADHQDWEYC